MSVERVAGAPPVVNLRDGRQAGRVAGGGGPSDAARRPGSLVGFSHLPREPQRYTNFPSKCPIKS